MKTWYGLWKNVRRPHRGQEIMLSDLWIQRGSVSDIQPDAPWHGELVVPMGRDIPTDSDQLRAAEGYCQRQCRALNALALVAYLDGLITVLTPLDGYFKAMLLGECRLASFILRAFKDDREIVAAQKEAEELYSDPSIPY